MNGRTAIESSAACGRAGAESGDALLVTVTRCGAGARAGASCPAPKATQAVTAIANHCIAKCAVVIARGERRRRQAFAPKRQRSIRPRFRLRVIGRETRESDVRYS